MVFADYNLILFLALIYSNRWVFLLFVENGLKVDELVFGWNLFNTNTLNDIKLIVRSLIQFFNLRLAYWRLDSKWQGSILILNFCNMWSCFIALSLNYKLKLLVITFAKLDCSCLKSLRLIDYLIMKSSQKSMLTVGW